MTDASARKSQAHHPLLADRLHHRPGLSHLNGENLAKMKRAIHGRRWREITSIAASLRGAENVARHISEFE